MRQMLELLRIPAEAQVLFNAQVRGQKSGCHKTHSSIEVLHWDPRQPSSGDDIQEAGASNQSGFSSEYLKSASEIVRRRSSDTAVTFLYMPKPPWDETEHARYYDELTMLTDNWPPTMIVRGVSPVTSITL